MPNTGKQATIQTSLGIFERIPIKTHVITDKDDIVLVIEKATKETRREGDFIFVSERVVAISQGRAYPIDSIKPSWLAKLLVKFVHKSPYGIGLGSPWTMELALREAGVARMLFAAFASALTKPFGMRGVFYKVVGKNINAIDGPCDYTLPPYNHYAKLGPKDPDSAARKIFDLTGSKTVIIDANDLGVTVLGRSHDDIAVDFCKEVFKDNPLGQTDEQTPIAVVRKA